MRLILTALVLTGCIEFPEAPRCSPGGCPSGLVCDPGTSLCIEAQDSDFPQQDRGVERDGGGMDASGGAGGGGRVDAAPPGDARVDQDVGGAGGTPMADAGMDAGLLDSGAPDARLVDAGAPDAHPMDAGAPDAVLPEGCQPDDTAPRVLNGINAGEIALASSGNSLLAAWKTGFGIGGRLRVQVGERELPLFDGLMFGGQELHAAGTAGRFALTWVEGQSVVVRPINGALALLTERRFASDARVRFPQIIAVPSGWLVVWQEVAAGGVTFMRGQLDVDGRVAGQPVPLNDVPLGEPATPRAHTLVLRGESVFVVWDPGPAPGPDGPPGLFVGRISSGFENPMFEVIEGTPRGQAPTAAAINGVVYLLWLGMEDAMLLLDPEDNSVNRQPPDPVPALAGRQVPVAVNDDDTLGVLACTALSGLSCEGLGYVRVDVRTAQSVAPEWMYLGTEISQLRLVAVDRGVAAAWIEEREGERRAVLKPSLLTPMCLNR
jgi:hypothetical protein